MLTVCAQEMCVDDVVLLIDLVELNIRDFDVFLGMDWLFTYLLPLIAIKRKLPFDLQISPNFP